MHPDKVSFLAGLLPIISGDIAGDIMKEIALTQNQVALVNDADFEWLSQWKWWADKGANTFYAGRMLPYINGKRGKLKMHHAIIGKPPEGYEVDHIDNNGLNNQRDNLRFVTRRQNQQNLKYRFKLSCYPGVSWFKPRQNWRARIQINGTIKNLGYFTDEFQAFRAYQQAVNALGQTVIDTAIQQRSIS